MYIVAPFVQNSARLEQRNTVPKPWGTQGEDSSLPLLMRVWTAGYTSQTSCSPVQTWISRNTETPWPYQIAKASLEARRFPLRFELCFVPRSLYRPSYSSQRMLVLHLCNLRFALQKRLHMQITYRAESVMLWGLSTLYTFIFKNLAHCKWAISPLLSILRKSNCPRLMPQECVKRPLCMTTCISAIQKTRSSLECGTFLNIVHPFNFISECIVLMRQIDNNK